MADLVRGLARALGEPVLDETGFTGEFDIDLNYTDLRAPQRRTMWVVTGSRPAPTSQSSSPQWTNSG
jgi:uncharacterized protein (TIGR03435 family)